MRDQRLREVEVYTSLDDNARPVIVEDRNQEPHKIYGVQKSPEGTTKAAA